MRDFLRLSFPLADKFLVVLSQFLETAHLWLPGMLAMTGLVCVSSFFSSSETALFYLSHEQLRSFRTGKRRERAVANLLSDPDRLLTAILFWNLIVNLLFFAVSVVIASKLADANQPVAAAMYGVLSVVGIILFGEVLPKSVAVVFPRRISVLVVWPLAAAVKVLDPVIPTLSRITRALRRAFWPHLKQEAYLDSDDLERAVEASELSEEVIRHEREILINVLELSEITAEEVMRPRGTYLAIQQPGVTERISGRVPPGRFVLIIDRQENEKTVPLGDLSVMPKPHLISRAEDVVYVPWCANLAHVLKRLREQLSSLACVVNEHGETIGVVTYDDLIDTILLPQASRTKRVLQREPVLEIAPGRYHVDGMTTLRYLSKRLHLDYEPETEGLVTLAGMLHEELEHLPQVGDECHWRGFHIKVIEVYKRGQLRAMISAKQERRS